MYKTYLMLNHTKCLADQQLTAWRILYCEHL